ncbi:MAG: hypothetical protein IPK26_30080 [Planctomycetes bacterium]|nr:hypothetical protein [Planctomycetota bacterium]
MNDDPLELLNFLDRLAADLAAGRDRPLAHYLQQFPRAATAVAEEYERAQRRRREAGLGGGVAELHQVRR